LNSDYKGFIDDITELLKLRTIVFNFRRSKKIAWLVKLGLLNKF
jgi:hypothetical protein